MQYFCGFIWITRFIPESTESLDSPKARQCRLSGTICHPRQQPWRQSWKRKQRQRGKHGTMSPVTLPAGVSNGHIEKNCAEKNWSQPCHCLQKLELHKRTKATTITDTPERFSKTRWTFAVLKCVFELKQAGPRWVIVRSDSAAAAAPFTTQSLLAMFAPSKCFLRPKKC